MQLLKNEIKKIFRHAGFDVTRMPKFDSDTIHFLHIGKAAGTAITHLSHQVNQIKGKNAIIKRNHDVFLKDIPDSCLYFFSIRDPISRFKSGFYSKKRRGWPRIKTEWSASEELAFQSYEQATELAEDLFEPDERGARAWAAMKSIRHTAQNQSDWFYCYGHFLSVRPPVWIIRQEYFEQDFADFLNKSGLDIEFSDLKMPAKPIETHANDYAGLPDISDKALRNLRNWYCQDVEFYRMCENWMEEHR